MDVNDYQNNQVRVKDDVGDRCQKIFQDFLEEYKDASGSFKYHSEAENLMKPERNTLKVEFVDLEKFNQTLATTVQEEYYRCFPFMCRAVRNFVNDRAEAKLEKEFYVSFIDLPTRHKVRELTTSKIGTLLRISGQVVRTHPVHPELISGTFTCLDCQNVIKDVLQQFKYTEPNICHNPVCNNRSRFLLNIDKSRFVDFQKVRIQETQAELPRGCIPRSVEVILRAEAVETAQAGDRCDFTGTLVVVPDVRQLATAGVRTESGSRQSGQGFEGEGLMGLKALGVREMSYRLAFLACSVTQTNPRFGGKEICSEDVSAEVIRNQMTPQEWEKIYNMNKDKNLYNHLITSLFPTIHGSDEIKRGILLMLFGGVHKTTIEGTSLRGDINICIVGDPSTAKSQFLKQVTDFSTRSVYTSGKASTAAGLTAAVVHDEESHEFVIEAGALMLADNGVCCIDEFDKMDQRDQIAIHEAMEQQTISITKAGIRATLNARTSILAAANPIEGRYNRSKSLKQNIAMSSPIMSRFDLFFILVDECNEVTDYAVARRILDLHNENQSTIDRVYTTEEIQRYLIFARHFKPKLNPESLEFLVDHYKTLRQRDVSSHSKSAWRVTVRQLESMIRLAEAMAKVHCCDEVQPKHVKEAFRLLNKSIIRVEQPDIYLDEEEQEETEEQINGEEEQEQEKNKLKLSFEEYKALSNVLVLQLQKEEARVELEDDGGMKQSQLINWYLKEIENEIETEAELVQKKLVVEKVLERLITHDHVIIPLKHRGLKGSEEEDQDDPLLVVHPNYVA